MTEKPDELEQRVDTAIKAAYRDSPEWMEVRAAVEALKSDRRARIHTVLDQLSELGREAEHVAESIGKETERIAGRAKNLATEVQGALHRFFDKE
jgi:hypothetical protein